MKTNANQTIINGSLAATVLVLSGCAGTGGSGSGTPIETTGVIGSPSATTTISGRQLPAPDPKFGGVIKDGALQSKAWWAPRVVPPKQAPNVLLIMTDDVGFGAPSTFGGVIPTPTMDRTREVPFKFTGKIDKLTFKLNRSRKPKLNNESSLR